MNTAGNSPTSMNGKMACPLLEKTPVELRTQILSYVLDHDVALKRQVSITAEAYKDESSASMARPKHESLDSLLVTSSLFVLNRQLHEEALDVFYALNEFRISYNHLCTCEGRFTLAAINEQRIKHLEVYDVSPRTEGNQVCSICQSNGFGLGTWLMTLPNLRGATFTFDDPFSFATFARDVETEYSTIERRGERVELVADQVGELSMKGLPFNLTLHMPALSQGWRFLATTPTPRQIPKPIGVGEHAIVTVLSYLEFEANSGEFVPTKLYQYYHSDSPDKHFTHRLRLKSLTDGRKRIAGFTVALADVLSDIFVWDGHSDSIEWVVQPNVYTNWDFKEGIDV